MRKKHLAERIAMAAQKVASNYGGNGTEHGDLIANAFREFADAIEEIMKSPKSA